MESNTTKRVIKLFEVFLWCTVCEFESSNKSKQQSLFNTLRQCIYETGYPIKTDCINSSTIELYESYSMRLRSYIKEIDYSSPKQHELFNQTGRYANDFEQIRKISKGSFGKVYEAKSKIDNQSYAIKMISLKDLSGEEIYGKVLNEVKVCAQLWRSKFIIQYMAAWLEEFNTKLYIQMELCAMTLQHAISKINAELGQNDGKPLTKVGAYMATELFTEILKGVQYLHNRFIHRDLKPSNILLTFSGHKHFIKICDFGLTRLYPTKRVGLGFNSTDITNYNHNVNNDGMTEDVGTIQFMSPEACTKYYTQKADMYSIGIIMTKLFNYDSNQFGLEKKDNLDSVLIDDDSDQFLRYSRKLFSTMKDLCETNDANRRPLCDKILRERKDWSIKFDDIKSDDYVRQICIESTKSSDVETPLSKIIILKKFEWHLDSVYSELNACNHYNEIKAAKLSKTPIKETNIEDEKLRTLIFGVVMHALHIFGSYGDICHYIKSSLDNADGNYKWNCKARMNYQYVFNENEIRFNSVYFSVKFVDECREDAMLMIDIYRKINENDRQFGVKYQTLNYYH